MDFEKIIKEATLASEKSIKETETAGTGYKYEGDCGFAWIEISGRGNFAKFVKENGYGTKGVYKGVVLSSYAFNSYIGQSMHRKEASLKVVSEILTKHGIKNTVRTRLD